MLPIVQLGPLAIQTPGLILLLGLWISLYLSERFAKKRSFDPGLIYTLTFIGIVSAFIGARLFYILEFPAAFTSNPLSIFAINASLLNWWGGVAGAFISILWYGQRQKLDLWQTLDIFTPALSSFNIFIALANLASGNAYGAPTDLPWAIYLWGTSRHPSQLYEMISAGVILGITIIIFNQKNPPVKGIPFSIFLGLTSASRLFLEAFRGDSYMVGVVRLAQIGYWILLAFSLWLLRKRLTQA